MWLITYEDSYTAYWIVKTGQALQREIGHVTCTLPKYQFPYAIFQKRIPTSASAPGISHTLGSVTFDSRRRFTEKAAGITSDVASGKFSRIATVMRRPLSTPKDTFSSEGGEYSSDGQNGEFKTYLKDLC